MFENSAAPASVVLKELLEGKKASKEQLMRVLEERRSILTRCTKNFSQKTLGQLACLDSGNGFFHELKEDGPRVISFDNEFRLDSRGFFAGNSLCKRMGFPWECVTFGVDHNSWLLVKTCYTPENRGGVYEKAFSVEVTRTNLSIILEGTEIEPTLIWMYFKMITEEWVSSRKSLYEQALKVAQGMNEEDCLFRMIS